jgi:hypothetical protein
MFGIWGHLSGEYLFVLATGTIILFGLPLLFWPLSWARVLRWPIPEQTYLTIYFGRCLGGVICVIAYFALRAGKDPEIQPFFFNMVLSSFALMIAIHIYGAIKRIQPLSETLEIFYWVSLFLVTLCFYPI